MQTEYEFQLPRGYVAPDGTLHKTGTMRLATAADEILPMKDPRVQQNPSYLSIIILTRVVTKLGTLTDLSTNIIENLFTSDLNYLQDLYQRINNSDVPAYKVTCPKCNEEVELPISFFQSNE